MRITVLPLGLLRPRFQCLNRWKLSEGFVGSYQSAAKVIDVNVSHRSSFGKLSCTKKLLDSAEGPSESAIVILGTGPHFLDYPSCNHGNRVLSRRCPSLEKPACGQRRAQNGLKAGAINLGLRELGLWIGGPLRAERKASALTEDECQGSGFPIVCGEMFSPELPVAQPDRASAADPDGSDGLCHTPHAGEARGGRGAEKPAIAGRPLRASLAREASQPTCLPQLQIRKD